MAFHFHKAGYPDKLIQDSFNRAFYLDREPLLIPKPDKTSDDRDENKLFLITTHHPTFRGVNDIISKNKELLDRSSSTRPSMQTDIVHGFRRCKNLRDLLVRAKLMPEKEQNIQPNNRHTACHKCRCPFCIYCSKLDRSGRILCNITKRSYMTRTNVSCLSTNIIYAIVCLRCGKIYVGQTKRRLMDRLMEHFRNIRQNNDIHIVGRHYKSRDHEGLNDLSV